MKNFFAQHEKGQMFKAIFEAEEDGLMEKQILHVENKGVKTDVHIYFNDEGIPVTAAFFYNGKNDEAGNLQEKLKKALEEEDYALAAKLKKQIEGLNKK